MRRHHFDAISFTFGLIFVAVGALLTVEGIDLSIESLRWAATVFLLGLGGVLLIGARTRRDPPNRRPIQEEGGHDRDGTEGS